MSPLSQRERKAQTRLKVAADTIARVAPACGIIGRRAVGNSTFLRTTHAGRRTTQPSANSRPLCERLHNAAASELATAMREDEALLSGLHCQDYVSDSEKQLIAATVASAKVRVAMDSAAVDHVIHADELPDGVECEPNVNGKHFVGANLTQIERYGSCKAKLANSLGEIGCEWPLADVTRAFHSVAKVTGPKDGPGKQDVLFNNQRCVVVPAGVVEMILREIQPIAEYKREGNLYVAEMDMSGLARPDQEP